MSAKKKSGKKKWIITGVILVVIAGIITFFATRPRETNYEKAEAQKGDIVTYYSFSGNVESKNRQTVVAEKLMQVSEIKVKEGDKVAEGDVLLTSTTGDEVKAKIAGEVSSLTVEENESVMAGVALMEVVDYDALEIAVNVDEYDLSALEVGKEATVSVGAIDKEITGTIGSISKEGHIENGVTYFTATVDLEEGSDFKVGMSAEVRIVHEEAQDVVTLSMNAIKFNDDNTPYVLLEDENGNPVKTEITTGINDGTMAEIKEGVSAGDVALYTKTSTTSGMMFGGGSSDE